MTKFLLITLLSWLLVVNSGAYEKLECFNPKDGKIYVTIINKGKIIAVDSYEVSVMMDSISSRTDMTVEQKIKERERIIEIIKTKHCKF